jgi:NAD(P) transhydrogenase subunit alpha
VSEPVVWLTIFILSVFVGVEVISKVSSTLHTPLMSGANAIHGIILLGAILVSGYAHTTLQLVIGLVAVVLASINMVGGFVVTDRMLQMFTRKRPKPRDDGAGGGSAPMRSRLRRRSSGATGAPAGGATAVDKAQA